MQIVIPLYDRFTALDAVGPYEVLRNLPGADVRFGALEPGPITTDAGSLTIVAKYALADLDAPEIVVVPGGPGTRALATPDNGIVQWLQQVHPQTQWTTSVCTGSLLLAAAGILDGLEATTHWSAMELLEALGAKPTKRRVVEQGKVITAAGVSSGIDMGLTLAAHLAGDDVAQAIQLGIEYDPQPPFDSGSVDKARPEIVDLVRALRPPAPAAAPEG
jgi:putative intracellular protease/amidase